MEDGTLCVNGLAVAVGGGGGRVKTLREVVLCFGRSMGLVLDDENLMGEECVVKDGKIGIYRGENELVMLWHGGSSHCEKPYREVTDFTGGLP